MKENEFEVIRRFIENCEALQNHTLIKDKALRMDTNIHIENGAMSVSRPNINEELMESLLVRIRRFNNQKDDLFFPRIINILCQNECDKEKQIFLKELSKLFMSKKEYSSLKYNYNNEDLTENDVFDLYINGKIFHTDKDKRLKIISITTQESFEYDMFLSAVMNKVKAILYSYAYLNQKGIC